MATAAAIPKRSYPTKGKPSRDRGRLPASESPVIRVGGLPLDQRIAKRRAEMLAHKYQVLGRLSMMIFDPEAYRAVKHGEIMNPNALDWLSHGPMLALSQDGIELLVIDPVPHPPDLPDTSVYPAIERPQNYRDRSRKSYGQEYIVFEPVEQILFKPLGVASWALIACYAGFDGTKVTFLVNPKTGEGHFVGGRFVIGAAK